MLNGIFTFESTRQRHCASPLLAERDALLQAMLKQGTSIQRVRSISSMLLHVVRVMKLQSLQYVEAEDIQAAAKLWANQTGHKNRNGKKNEEALFLYVASKWFRFHGVLHAEELRDEPNDTYAERFVSHITVVRGLSPDTVRSARLRVRAFLKWNSTQTRCLADVTMNHIDDYIKVKRDSGYLPRSVVGVCSALRLLFQFAEKEGLNERKIALAIRRPRVDRFDRDPKGPKWAEVRRMLDHDFGSTPADLRGDAILALASIYAFRSNEIKRLLLGDLDWVNETLTIRRAKSRRLQQFPLQVEVGEKIIRYLKHSRPRCTCRNLFVTLKPPYREVDSCSLWVVISRRIKQLNIETKTFGSHALRHACATHLLQQGTSLPDIAEFLGHKDLKSVSIYAKHDIRALREVASMSLKEVL